MKTKMNKFRFSARLLLLALTAFTMQAKAQLLEHGFGAEDNNNIEAVLHPGELTVAVTLGNPDENDEDAQYHWELLKVSTPNHDISYNDGWPNTLDPVVTLTGGIWLFQVTRASKYGLQTENVVVNVLDRIEVTATPKDGRCCWRKNEDISMDQFDITTNPKGLSRYVALKDNSRKATHKGFSVESEQEIFFEAVAGCDYSVFGQTTITVVDDEMLTFNINTGELSVPESIKKAKKALETFKDLKGVKDRYKRVTMVLDEMKEFGPIEFDFSYGFGLELSFGKECCCGKESGFMKVSGDANAGIEVNATLNPIPAVPPLVLNFGVEGAISYSGLGLKLSESLFDGDDCGCPSLDFIPFQTSVEISGIVGLEAFDEDILSVSGGVVGGISFELKYKLSQGFIESEFNYYIKFVAAFKAVGFGGQWEYILFGK